MLSGARGKATVVTCTRAEDREKTLKPLLSRSSSFVCLFVCFFVSIYSRTTGYEAAYERYQQLQCYKGRKINVAILLKRLRSRDMA